MTDQHKSDIPHIPVAVSLPAGPETEGRWAEPYMSKGKIVLCTRRPLSQAEVRFGLRSVISASTVARLKEFQAAEDSKAEEYRKAREIPALPHRSSGP